MTDDTTLATYDARAEAYTAASTPGPHGPLHEFLTEAVAISAGRHGRAALEVGAGPGHDALLLESLGMRVRRTDGSASFVDTLRAQGHDADVLDVRRDPLGGPYDVMLAKAVLLHLDRTELAEVLQRAREAATVLVMTLKEGDGEGWSTARLDAPRWFTYWREEPLRSLLESTGWNVARLEHVDGREPWLFVLAS
jgi:2-polyprenyl-3-methyl-5-hydroxy-6-metoxy-1,4-benzoquinol methylase